MSRSRRRTHDARSLCIRASTATHVWLSRSKSVLFIVSVTLGTSTSPIRRTTPGNVAGPGCPKNSPSAISRPSL